MKKEFEAYFNTEAPTFFEGLASWQRNLGSGDRKNVILPFTLEDLVAECADVDVAVTSLVDAEDKSLLRVSRENSAFYEVAAVYDTEEGLKMDEVDVYKLRKLLFEEERVITEKDIQNIYKNEAKRLNGLPVLAFKGNIGFGEFLEEYQLHQNHVLTDGTDEWVEFEDGFESTAMDFRLYFAVDDLLRRRGLLKKHQLIDPMAYFCESSGRLKIGINGEDIYFWKFVELMKGEDGLSRTVGFMRIGREIIGWSEEKMGEAEGAVG